MAAFCDEGKIRNSKLYQRWWPKKQKIKRPQGAALVGGFQGTTTATATKTSPENMSLFHLCYFAIISTRSTFTKMANYPGTKLVVLVYKLRKKMKNSPSCVHVLHETLNAVISRCCFAEDGKEMYQNVKRKCRAIVFAHQAYCFAALSLPSPLLKLPIGKKTTGRWKHSACISFSYMYLLIEYECREF